MPLPRRRRKGPKKQDAIFSGAHKGGRDPVRLGDALNATANKQGWSGSLIEGALISDWVLIVGPELANHVSIKAYLPQTKELVLVADSPAWATQTKLLQRQLLAKIAERQGPSVVTRVRIARVSNPE